MGFIWKNRNQTKERNISIQCLVRTNCFICTFEALNLFVFFDDGILCIWWTFRTFSARIKGRKGFSSLRKWTYLLRYFLCCWRQTIFWKWLKMTKQIVRWMKKCIVYFGQEKSRGCRNFANYYYKNWTKLKIFLK